MVLHGTVHHVVQLERHNCIEPDMAAIPLDTWHSVHAGHSVSRTEQAVLIKYPWQGLVCLACTLCMQGFLMMGPDKLGTGAGARDKYLRLWVHEVSRR
jgi:hypothetical protein